MLLSKYLVSWLF